MKPMNGKKLLAVLLAACASAVIVLLIGGCGGGSGSPSSSAAQTGWKQVGATYVGRGRCRDCHASIDDQYAQQDMGDNAETAMSGTNCQNCHVTGYGEPSGFKADGSTPHLDGIGCEDCHGPGSKHVAASTNDERIANITRVPPSDKACWGCHGDRIKNADGTYSPGAIYLPAVPVTAATLHAMNPGKVSTPHHAPAQFLLGRNGYGMAQTMPSPHSTLDNTCLDCHKPGISPINGQVNHGVDALLPPNLDRSRTECAYCHGGRNDTAVQTGIKAKLIELGGEDPANPGEPDGKAGGGLLHAYQVAHTIDTTTNLIPDDPFVIAYKGARYNFSYVRGDASLGVHNPEFATKLLDDAIAALQPSD